MNTAKIAAEIQHYQILNIFDENFLSTTQKEGAFRPPAVRRKVFPFAPCNKFAESATEIDWKPIDGPTGGQAQEHSFIPFPKISKHEDTD